MSYDTIIEYKIIPTETFKITRGCAGCGCKQTFACKDHFRVNANGNRLDVWLIYGCEKCGHTYNLPVYKRVNPAKIPVDDYRGFLSNDREKVFKIGTDKAIFTKNKAEIAWDLFSYEMVPITGKKIDLDKERIQVRLHNPYGIPVRADKAAAWILQITRSEAKRLLRKEIISVSEVGNAG